jgi:hypothetical protein
MEIISTSLGSLFESNSELVKLYSEAVLLIELVYREKLVIKSFSIL